MPLLGTAFVIMWHDIAPEGEQEYHNWHTRQHMPERLGHPGFLRSRRGVNWNAPRQRYFTLYEGETLDTFLSDEYRASLNGPTEWTSRVAPTFRNFLRMACAVQATGGAGVGGALATIRFARGEGMGEADAARALEPVIAALAGLDAVTGVHTAAARPDFAGGETTEVAIRPPMSETPFDMVIVVEGMGLRELDALAPDWTDAVAACGMRDVIVSTYDMAYLLERTAA